MTKFIDVYEKQGILGKGAFSIVYKCREKETGNEYAAKIIKTAAMSVRELIKLEREARINRKVEHQNIVRLHNTIQELETNYFIMDLVTGGELFEEIVARQHYSEIDASTCMAQILMALDHCHERGIIHRDLKPENLLLSSRDKNAIIKLADFGLAVEVKGENEPHSRHGFAGTPCYMSPEVVTGVPYGKEVDMWSCGVILYILLVGYPPWDFAWEDDMRHKLYSQIKAGQYRYESPEWDEVTSEAKYLIDQMMSVDPQKRITAKEALNHPWISQREQVASHSERKETIHKLKTFLSARGRFRAAVFATIVARKTDFGKEGNGDCEPPYDEEDDLSDQYFEACEEAIA